MPNPSLPQNHEFLSPSICEEFLDRYVIRSGILSALKEALPRLSGNLLDVGAGRQPYRSVLTSPSSKVCKYYPLDIAGSPTYPESEFTWDGITMPFGDQLFDCAIATEVLEHCPQPELTLREIHRVLKPGGVFFFTVPFVWPLHDCPYDEYRYTPFSLKRHLVTSGFVDVQLRPTGGWDATLAQVLGLWLRRRPMNPTYRRILSKLFLPAYKWLLRRDLPPRSFDNEGYLMPGISGTALKPPPPGTH